MQGLRHGPNDVLLLLVGQAVVHRQADGAFIVVNGIGKITAFKSKTAVIGLRMHRYVVNIYRNPRFAQAVVDFAARARDSVDPNSNDI